MKKLKWYLDGMIRALSVVLGLNPDDKPNLYYPTDDDFNNTYITPVVEAMADCIKDILNVKDIDDDNEVYEAILLNKPTTEIMVIAINLIRKNEQEIT